MSVIAYGPTELVEQTVATVEEIASLRSAHPVIWINVNGLGSPPLIEALGREFGLHRLALEDVVNAGQRPKAVDYGEHEYLVLRMPSQSAESDGALAALRTTQLSLFFWRGCVLTFQEKPGTCFDPVRTRLREGRRRLRGAGADYLAYALIDAVIDGFLPLLDQWGDRLEHFEDIVLEDSDRIQREKLHRLKRDVSSVRRIAWSTREALGVLLRDDAAHVEDTTQTYFRDCMDHTTQLIDVAESYRDAIVDLMDYDLSSASNRMNETMKVLTVVAAIFIPLTFVAGIYGMNFDRDRSPLNMPELGWYFGYPTALLLMVLIATGMVVFFRQRGWLGRRTRRDDDERG